MTTGTTPAKNATPMVIHNVTAMALLEIHWSGGIIRYLPHYELRQACPCAGCRAIRLRGDVRMIDPNVRIAAINSMGYGIQLIFDDGHGRGIYPWPYLNTLDSQISTK